jgi:hypothetical protein
MAARLGELLGEDHSTKNQADAVMRSLNIEPTWTKFTSMQRKGHWQMRLVRPQ